MNTTSSALTTASRPGWQLLGQIELLADATTDSVSTWLIACLASMNLPPDFVTILLDSVHEVTLRVLDPNGGTDNKHVHLAILALKQRSEHSNSWGFFRIEKIDDTEWNKTHPDLTVEFYLYLEGI